MEKFITHTGLVAPLDRVNIDTDAIIPKQFLRKIERTGFGKHLFHAWRYTDYDGTKENPEFVLNKHEFRKATILLTRDNFGCGSSREHAPWALSDYGFRVIIAPSFADIFYNNCIKNGVLLIQLKSEEVEELFQEVNEHHGVSFTAELESKILVSSSGKIYKFNIDSFNKTCLINGLDQIGWAEQFNELIHNYENRLKISKPWLVQLAIGTKTRVTAKT